jgi:2-polyprenyl-3-methyl-5-hydroxy-6-metoxy-1,4-benzoquinol methylase
MASWADAKAVIGDERVTLGPQASAQWIGAPDHLAMVLARYRAAAALIGSAGSVLEVGCGEGIGARLLAAGRDRYVGIDPDAAAIRRAEETVAVRGIEFSAGMVEDVARSTYDAAVALDVLEHLPAGHAGAWLHGIAGALDEHGVCVIGTPNAAFDHLASAPSRAGHVRTYRHGELYALMRRCFRVVQSFGMQDTALHLGHPEARHYLLMCGIAPRG